MHRIKLIHNFRVTASLFFHMKLLLIMKWFLILMHIKLIFTRKVLHLASFWKWEFLELRNGLLIQNALWCVINTQSSEGSLGLITEQVLIFFLLLRFLPQWMSLFLLTETYHCVNLQFSFVNIIRYWSCLTPRFQLFRLLMIFWFCCCCCSNSNCMHKKN